MSIHLLTPTSRLICFGSAKACTNATDLGNDEDDPRFGKPE
ncbi:hypothetical protein [Phenylobacterium sp. RIFCSPHIGHO2_01_FULL_69_31]|nr:hypothetical protein [Phenylobacterium sp. RIFCSPHIGHO2_01_FULL_69_31]